VGRLLNVLERERPLRRVRPHNVVRRRLGYPCARNGNKRTRGLCFTVRFQSLDCAASLLVGHLDLRRRVYGPGPGRVRVGELHRLVPREAEDGGGPPLLQLEAAGGR